GAYAFEAVPAGEYRVRRVTEGTAGKANGQTIKITGDGKPQTLNFGKPARRGRTSLDHLTPAVAGPAAQVAWHEEPESPPELEQAFQEWCDLEEPDDSPTAWWLSLVPLIAAVAWTRPACAGEKE
ncbi:MAG: hypothetical protein JNM56_35865, partial [Planctomycetia bacterium]|nr:hypothetical protein [Planctomycetia bacterium]